MNNPTPPTSSTPEPNKVQAGSAGHQQTDAEKKAMADSPKVEVNANVKT